MAEFVERQGNIYERRLQLMRRFIKTACCRGGEAITSRFHIPARNVFRRKSYRLAMVEQYGIYWVNLDPTQGSEIAKTRPCVVVSPDDLNRHLRTVVVIPITSTIKNYPFRVRCVIKGKQGEIATDQIRTIDKSRLNTDSPLGRLSLNEWLNLRDVLNQMFCQ